MDAFIVNLKLRDVGYHVNHQYVVCFLYVDDVILILPSINCLQQMYLSVLATAKLFAFMSTNDTVLVCTTLFMLILVLCYSTINLGVILLVNILVFTC